MAEARAVKFCILHAGRPYQILAYGENHPLKEEWSESHNPFFYFDFNHIIFKNF